MLNGQNDRTDLDRENQKLTEGVELVWQIWTRSADHHTGPRLLKVPHQRGLTEDRTRSHALRVRKLLHHRRQPQKLIARMG
jgi:hypothetical protein